MISSELFTLYFLAFDVSFAGTEGLVIDVDCDFKGC